MEPIVYFLMGGAFTLYVMLTGSILNMTSNYVNTMALEKSNYDTPVIAEFISDELYDRSGRIRGPDTAIVVRYKV